MVRTAGRCAVCGHRPARGPDGRNPRHDGTCPECATERSMRCCKPPKLHGKCGLHGGKGNEPGPLHPNAKRGGLYSKVMPKHLRAGYERALADPELSSSREHIAVIRSMILDLWGRFEDAGGLRLWVNLNEAVEGLFIAIRSNDPAQVIAAASRLRQITKRGKENEQSAKQLLELIDRCGREQDRETRRMAALNQVMTAEQVLAVLLSISHSIARNCSNPRERAVIAEDIRQITGAPLPADRPALPPREVEDAPAA